MESVPTPDHAAGGRNGALVKPFALRAIAGSRLRLDSIDQQAARDERLSVILCERGTVLTTPPGIVALACPILGGASVMTGEWSAHLRKADIVVGDAQTRHDIVVSPRGACIVVAGTRAAWAALDRNGGPAVRSATVLFPAVHRARQALCRRLLRLARHCLGDARAPGGKHLAQQLACFVDDLQAGFAVMIARCPGSSLPRKKAVFLRLQRVRNFISACAHEDLDVARLALMANYSVGHFITTFRCVFEETPYSNVSRYRLESASSLLTGSKRGIADIAQAIGFQSRSSFTRAIKKHLGSSATQFRASLGGFEPPPSAHGDTAERSISGNRRDSGPSELPNGQEQE